MPILDKVNQLTNKQRLLALGGVIVALGVIFFMYGYSPRVKAIALKETELGKLNSELQGLRVVAARLPEFKAETLRLEGNLKEIRKKLPQDKEIPGLLDSISKAGLESGLQFELFQPQAEAKKEFYSEVPVSISVRGPFHNIAAFIDKVTHLPRIVNVGSFSFTAPKEEGGYVFVNGTGVATTYRYNEKS